MAKFGKTATVLLILCLIVSALTGCGGKSVEYSEYKYGDASEYLTGDVSGLAEEFDSVDIDWLSGEVMLVYSADDSASLTESANMDLTDGIRLRYRVSGKTLMIKYCADGAGEELINLTKKLTLTLPAGKKLSRLNVSTTTADVLSDGVNAGQVTLTTLSGCIATKFTDSDSAAFNTTEGSIDTELDSVRDVKLETGAGSIDAIVKDAVNAEFTSTTGSVTVKQKGDTDKLRIESAAGKIELKANNIKNPEINSTSGNIKMKFKTVPLVINARTTSGKMTIQLPPDAGFTATIKSANGDFDCDFKDAVRNGKTYTRGDGYSDMNLSSTSGNINIKPIEEKEDK